MILRLEASSQGRLGGAGSGVGFGSFGEGKTGPPRRPHPSIPLVLPRPPLHPNRCRRPHSSTPHPTVPLALPTPSPPPPRKCTNKLEPIPSKPVENFNLGYKQNVQSDTNSISNEMDSPVHPPKALRNTSVATSILQRRQE